MTTIHQRIRLAREFGSRIQEALSRAQFRAAVDANKADGYESPICHTHDYCDSNVCMLQAFESTFGREPDSASEADAATINEAWQIAKAADFFA